MKMRIMLGKIYVNGHVVWGTGGYKLVSLCSYHHAAFQLINQ